MTAETTGQCDRSPPRHRLWQTGQTAATTGSDSTGPVSRDIILVMSNVGGPSGSWTRCTCGICFGHLEFDSEHVGETIQCPHCGMPTILFIPRIPRTSSQPIPAKRLSLSVCSRCGASLDQAAERCPECGQAVQKPAPGRNGEGRYSFTEGWSESAGIWLIIGTLLVVVIGTPLYWLQNQYAQMPKPETEWQQKSRFQAEAQTEMLKECTNVLVGLTRVIHSSVLDAEDNPQLWTGLVTAEFVNRFGGVERTNVPFRFSTDTGTDGLMHVRSFFDSGPPLPPKRPAKPAADTRRRPF